jgi:hypothetical protein
VTAATDPPAFDVRSGDVWELQAASSRHLFGCSDVVTTEGRLLDTMTGMLSSDGSTVVYCDPPWGNGLLKQFASRAGMPPPPYSYLAIYEAAYRLGARLHAPVFVETGKRWRYEVADAGVRHAPLWAEWEILYYRKNPAVLLGFAPQELPAAMPDLTGVDDEKTPGLVLTAFPRGVVVDVCAGKGITSRAALAAGWSSVNNELSTSRMSAAMAKMSHLAMAKPTLLVRP